MRVVWTPAARDDQHRMWLFQAERSVVLADRIESRLTSRCDTLGALPFQGRPKPGGYRELSVPDIGLAVIYRIDDDAVRILRLWNTRQQRETP